MGSLFDYIDFALALASKSAGIFNVHVKNYSNCKKKRGARQEVAYDYYLSISFTVRNIS